MVSFYHNKGESKPEVLRRATTTKMKIRDATEESYSSGDESKMKLSPDQRMRRTQLIQKKRLLNIVVKCNKFNDKN